MTPLLVTLFMCRIGSSMGTGSTPTQAKAEARVLCGEKAINSYLRRHKTITESEITELVLECINLECE